MYSLIFQAYIFYSKGDAKDKQIYIKLKLNANGI